MNTPANQEPITIMNKKLKSSPQREPNHKLLPGKKNVQRFWLDRERERDEDKNEYNPLMRKK